MPAPARQGMTAVEFFEWLVHQERRHELVDGEPRMMAGADLRHDRIVLNAVVSLSTQLRGKQCRAFTADVAVRVPAGNIRYPDCGVDCGTFAGDAMAAIEPTLVVEVLSPSTRAFDRTRKIEEYKTVPTMRYVLLIDPDGPHALFYRREADGLWSATIESGPDAVLEFPAIGAEIRLADLYEGLD
jgi:Uma2 family endonuclease